MNDNGSFEKDLKQIIAVDQRFSTITPEDDQVWELETSKGEPPGLAFQTTYGLRAYGIRVYPRFSIKKIPIFDPRSFASRPVLNFKAPNFLELQYSPFSSFDVNQKVWVPDSHTLTAQITLTNTSPALVTLWMEWIVQLNPLLAGTPMTAAQISVNTVLQGQTEDLFPVFLLTGGPRGDLSAFPSLGIDVTLTPGSSRQFSWALASLNTIEDSFYAARKATAYSMDNEQIKIEMLQKGQTVGFDFGDYAINQLIEQSQQRTFQLLLPPFRSLEFPWYVSKRDPEHGHLTAQNSNDYSANWGVQKITDIWALSRMLLPLRVDLVKGMLQNLLNLQGDDGTLYSQFNWNGSVTNLAAAPLIVALAVDINEQKDDQEWLARNYPALLRGIKIWFEPDHDRDGDGWPEWRHLLQTGLDSLPSNESKKALEVLIKTAEWPSLLALLINECRALKKIAIMLKEEFDLDWIESQINALEQMMLPCWDQKRGVYAFRDQEGHFSTQGECLHTFKKNDCAELKIKLQNPSRLAIRVMSHGGANRQLECQIKGVINHHVKNVNFQARDFQWEDETGLAVSDEAFSEVKSITVSGLKKGDRLTVETPDYLAKSPDFLVPLWAGIPSTKQAKTLIDKGIKYFEHVDHEIPFFLKIMWIEALCQYNHKELASQFFKQWYFGFLLEPMEAGTQSHHQQMASLVEGGLQNLIPVKTLLQLLGVERISEEELILEGFNDFFAKVNVQYKRFLLDLQPGQARIQNLNGESVLITEPGSYRIVLS